jgi:hypothetical protein
MRKMMHRHLNVTYGEWSIAVIESLWERGTDRDIVGLLQILREDPFGAAAQAVEKALPHSKVYATSPVQDCPGAVAFKKITDSNSCECMGIKP